MADEFQTNLFRIIAAELQLLCEMQIAREMFGKGYFELGGGEKLAVDQAALGYLSARYGTITPQWLASQTARDPLGFQPPTSQAAPAATGSQGPKSEISEG